MLAVVSLRGGGMLQSAAVGRQMNTSRPARRASSNSSREKDPC